MSETAMVYILILLGLLGVLLLLGVIANARRRHDFHRKQGRPELR